MPVLEAMTESNQQIPSQEALLLEFPCFVKTAQVALDSFGGQDAVSEMLAGTRQALQLKLRPGDPLAHPILGLKQQTQGLLLRLSTKTGAPTTCFIHHMQALWISHISSSSMAVVWGKECITGLCACTGQGQIDGNAGVQAEVVAHVKRCVRFSGMADFQYASCAHLPQGAEVCAFNAKMTCRYTCVTPSASHASPLLMSCQLRADSQSQACGAGSTSQKFQRLSASWGSPAGSLTCDHWSRAGRPATGTTWL